MTTYTAERIYELLPAIYRLRDAEQGYPLRSLLSVVAREIGIVEEDIARLYANWFVETSDEWIVPYIGDLLGVRGLHALEDAGFTRRAFVANTLSYRRRKGTPTMLEQLARDTTQWNARVVEFFELLGTTQYLNHLRPQNVRTPDLRRTNALELLDTPFDGIGHTADVRRIASGRGKHNIPNIGIFLWRLQAYNVTRSTPRALTVPADGRYTFSPLGNDAPLFNRPQTETTITHLAGEVNVPGRLRRRALYDDLENYRRILTTGKGSPCHQLLRLAPTGSPGLLRSALRGGRSEHRLRAAAAGGDRHLRFGRLGDGRLGAAREPNLRAQDPQAGRSAHVRDQGCRRSGAGPAGGVEKRDQPADQDRSQLRLRLQRRPGRRAIRSALRDEAGRSDADGLRKHGRRPRRPGRASTASLPPDSTRSRTPSPNGRLDGKPDAVIQVDDSRTYEKDLTIPMAATDLVIQAANRQRPTLIGNVTVTGNQEGRLALNGLLIAGSISRCGRQRAPA